MEGDSSDVSCCCSLNRQYYVCKITLPKKSWIWICSFLWSCSSLEIYCILSYFNSLVGMGAQFKLASSPFFTKHFGLMSFRLTTSGNWGFGSESPHSAWHFHFKFICLCKFAGHREILKFWCIPLVLIGNSPSSHTIMFVHVMSFDVYCCKIIFHLFQVIGIFYLLLSVERCYSHFISVLYNLFIYTGRVKGYLPT